MGTYNHTAVIVTTCIAEDVAAVKSWIEKNCTAGQKKLFSYSGSLINKYQTITLAPSGGSDGSPWEEEASSLRYDFIDFLESFKDPDDGSNTFEWVLITYGESGVSYPYSNRDKEASRSKLI